MLCSSGRGRRAASASRRVRSRPPPPCRRWSCRWCASAPRWSSGSGAWSAWEPVPRPPTLSTPRHAAVRSSGRENMRDERGFAGFVAERSAMLRRQARLLVGDPERAGALAGRAFADTGRRWDGLVAAGGADAAEEHARTILARAALRRPARGRRPVAAPATAAESHSVVPSGEAPAAAGDGAREAGDSGGGLAVVQLPSAKRAARVGLRTPAGGAGGGEAESGAGAGVDDAEAVWRALASLPPRRRAVLVLRYDEGLDDPSIAARLGVAAGAVATDGEAGIAALRSILRRRGRPEDLLGPALAARIAPPARSPVTASEASVRVRPRRRRLRRLVVGGLAAAGVARGG